MPIKCFFHKDVSYKVKNWIKFDDPMVPAILMLEISPKEISKTVLKDSALWMFIV